VRASSGTTNPIDDYAATIQAQSVDTSDFKATGTLYWPSGDQPKFQQVGQTDWKDYSASGMSDDFITNSTLTFDKRAVGYDSDEAVVQALMTQPNVAVVDAFVLESGGFGDDEDLFKVSGVEEGDDTFEPVRVQVKSPDSPTPATWTIIGIIDTKLGSLFGFYVNEQTFEEVFPGQQGSSYFVALTDPENSESVAKSIESAMLENGVQAESIRDELEESQRQSTGFFYIIQGFMALGLIVGIAAVGVIAFRSVVERRQQIGVLRALGYQRGMVALSFLIESAYIVGLGVISGTVLGLLLARNLFASGEFGSGDITFISPWVTLALILGSTIIAALLMTWAPAQQASRIAPAEALRYE
jgi:putative ABC transport system permease protein